MPDLPLKDSSLPEDPRLDRLVEQDDRCRGFAIGDRLRMLGEPTPRSYSWRCNLRLDQGQEGSCVGHGIAHELAARPSEVADLTHRFATEQIYWEAQKVDQWPGGEYPGATPRYGGTSVLAGAKVAKAIGFIESYHQAYSVDEMILGVGHHGPAVIGVNWHEGMFNPDSSGYIYVSGQVAGGHCVLVRAVDVVKKRFTIRNSWGIGWGMAGDAYLTFDNMARLLSEHGDCFFFAGRHTVPQPNA